MFKDGKSVDCEIVDVGPWNIDDPYWETGARPQAESGTDNTGRRTNLAGIDLTPAAADVIGLDGKGVVDWEFVTTDAVTPPPVDEPAKPAATLKEVLELAEDKKQVNARFDSAIAMVKKAQELADKPKETPAVDFIGMIPEWAIPAMWPVVQRMSADEVLVFLKLLGGKGANLAEMAGHPSLRLPVPPGFAITTDVCTYYYDHKRSYPKELKIQGEKALAQVEKIMRKKFGDAKDPLLVSVRSGARRSMPGMMETVSISASMTSRCRG